MTSYPVTDGTGIVTPAPEFALTLTVAVASRVINMLDRLNDDALNAVS